MAKALLEAWIDNGPAAINQMAEISVPESKGSLDIERWELLNEVAGALTASGAGKLPNRLRTRVCLKLLFHLSGGDAA